MNTLKKSLFPGLLLSLLAVALFTNIDETIFPSGSNVNEQIGRFVEVLYHVQHYYVKEVDTEKLVTGAINGMLEQLDPHSVYVPPKQLKQIAEQMEGHFEGIGIEFIVQNKVLTVVAPIVGTPSERLGIRPGDQIIKINGKSAYGITEQEVMHKLRGPKGTKVTVTIKRPGMTEPFDLRITRDTIPIYSVIAAFLLENNVGYVYVGRFAKTTADELEKALIALEDQGMKALILDLRLNSGGYLDQAVKVAEKFIEGGKKIVYTRGRIPYANEEFVSTGEHTHPRYPLIILINKGSASASEIVAGAVQDWDRGLIVGETSFGKGLVQREIPLKNGAALRLTIASYYTPSGRMIQRPYDKGWMECYTEALSDSAPNAASDTTTQKPVYTTDSDRKVYGGGGITPDITIKSEKITTFTSQLIFNRLFFEYGSNYASKHKTLAANFDKFKREFNVSSSMLASFQKLIKNKGIKFNKKQFQKDIEYIKLLIKSEIARNLWGSEKYYQIKICGDNQIKEAIKLIPKAAEVARIKWEGEGS